MKRASASLTCGLEFWATRVFPIRLSAPSRELVKSSGCVWRVGPIRILSQCSEVSSRILAASWRISNNAVAAKNSSPAGVSSKPLDLRNCALGAVSIFAERAFFSTPVPLSAFAGEKFRPKPQRCKHSQIVEGACPGNIGRSQDSCCVRAPFVGKETSLEAPETHGDHSSPVFAEVVPETAPYGAAVLSALLR